MYSLDTFVPVIDFGMQEEFTVTAEAGAGQRCQACLWTHIAAGWLLSSLAVIGVTGIVRRQ